MMAMKLRRAFVISGVIRVYEKGHRLVTHSSSVPFLYALTFSQTIINPKAETGDAVSVPYVKTAATVVQHLLLFYFSVS